MLSHLLVKKNGHIFVNAAGGDSYEMVRRRAARVALKENRTVNYQLINRKEYLPLGVDEARRIMTPTAWIEELRDYLSDPLTRKERKQLQKRGELPYIKMALIKERTELHKQCLRVDKEIAMVAKIISV